MNKKFPILTLMIAIFLFSAAKIYAAETAVTKYFVESYSCLDGCKKSYVSGINEAAKKGMKIIHINAVNKKKLYAIVTYEMADKKPNPEEEEKEDLSVPGMDDIDDSAGPEKKTSDLDDFEFLQKREQKIEANRKTLDDYLSMQSGRLSKCRKMYTVYGRDFNDKINFEIFVDQTGKVKRIFIEGPAKGSALASCLTGTIQQYKVTPFEGAPVQIRSVIR